MAKRRPRELLLAAGFTVGTIGFGSGTAALAQGTIDFTSTPVAGVIADALAAGPDGSLWSVNGAANSISHVTFPDLHVSTFPAPTAAAGLSGIAAGPDGQMWFTEADARKIGRIAASGAISAFPIPASAAAPQRIFSGPGGALWSFNACFASGCSRFVVTTTAGTSTELLLKVPAPASFSPVACTLGTDGNVWCIGNESVPHPFGSHFAVARITPTGGYTAFVPSTGTQGSVIVAAPDGNVWYAWELPGASTGVARVSPAGVVTEFPVATGNPHSWIFGLAVGADGDLYCADRQTSILYELVLSSASDSGTATFHSGAIAIDIPEDLVAVSNQSGTARMRTQDVLTCPERAFAVKSGGSLFGSLEWEEVAAAAICTDMVASFQVKRGDFIAPGIAAAEAACTIQTDVDTAFSATLTVQTLNLVYFGGPYGNKGEWTTCTSLGPTAFQCSAATMDSGDKFTALFGIVPNDKIQATCASTTLEKTPPDNQTPKISTTIGLPPEFGHPYDIDDRDSVHH